MGAELPSPKDEEKSGADGGEGAKVLPLYDYQDIRDDRVLTYFSIGEKDPKVFKTYVTKAYEGSFFMPAATVSAMYDEQRYQALVPGRWLTPGSAGGSGRR